MANPFLEGFAGMQDTLRKGRAYNAFRAAYGDVAGDPEGYRQLLAAEKQKAELPFAGPQAEAQLGETRARTGLYGAQQAGTEVETQGRQITNRYIAPKAEADIAETGARTGLLGAQQTGTEAETAIHQAELPYVGAKARSQIALQGAEAEHARQEAQNLIQTRNFNAGDRAALAGSYMVNEMLRQRQTGANADQLVQLFDQFAPQLAKLDQIDPQHLGMIRQAIQQDPDKTLPFLQNQLAGATGALDPATAHLLGQTFLQTGQMPALGQGKVGTFNRGLVLRNAGQQAAAAGQTGTDVVNNRQVVKSRQSFVTDLSRETPGSAGGLVRSAGAVLAHMDMLGRYIDALKAGGQGNIKIANAIRQEWQEQTGKPMPLAFNAQKEIVGDEITKFLIARGGTLEDRKAFKETLSRANSPAALKKVMETYYDDVTGQLAPIAQQADAVGARDQFDKTLMPRARELLTGHSSAPAQSNGGFTYLGKEP